MKFDRLLGISLLALPALAAHATPGALDTSFGGDGRVFNFWDQYNGATMLATVAQSDGKVLLAGNADNSTFAVERLNADGTLDTTFGSGGMVSVTTNIAGDSVRTARAIAVQADGRIVVAGDIYSTNPGRNYTAAVFRLNANGSIDTTFQPAGDHVWQFGSAQDSPVMRFNAIAIQPDGRIVLAGEGSPGSLHTSPPTEFMVVRLNANGSFDTTFAAGGVAMVAIIVRDLERSAANAVALQADGKVVVVGEAQGSDNDYDFGFLRLNANGSVDTTFGYYGQFTVAFDLGGDGVDKATGVVIQPSGRIVATGTVTAQAGDHTIVGVAGLTANGALDPTFGSGGRTHNTYYSERVGHSGTAVGIAQSPVDGALWVGGTQQYPVGSSYYPLFGWLRFDANGGFLGRGTVDPCNGACIGYGSTAGAFARDVFDRMIIAGTGNWYHPIVGPVIHTPVAVRLTPQ